jgi:hypothetical protein
VGRPFYWDIGRGILEKQERLGWGESVVEKLSVDLSQAFPGMRGFSARNLWEMRRFYGAYSEGPILQQAVAELRNTLPDKAMRGLPASATEILRQAVAEIPWGQHLLILNKVTDPRARLYYLRATAQLGWSRNVLLNQDDNPSIGIILCAGKDDVVVEFSLKTKVNPIGVAEYRLTSDLPKEMKGKLPSQSELRKALLPGETE